MSPSGLIPLSDIQAMLEHCAPNATLQRKKHRIWVRYHGLTFRGLPKGGHGDRRCMIESGHVVQMVRHLGVDPACAQAHLPILKLNPIES
jgi:hypothetical protein